MPGRGDVKPNQWGSDGLSSYLEDAYKNRWATFVQKPTQFRLLAEIDSCFEAVFRDWLNPGDLVGAHLFLRSHAAYRTACEHALAGQSAELFALVRSSLESAAYGLHIWKNPGLGEVWLRRHDDAPAMAAMKKEFLQGKLRATVKAANRKAAEVFDMLYQQSVDMGAHPNERAVTGNMDIVEMPGRREFRQIYLHSDGIQIEHGLKTVARCGVCVLEIMQEAVGPRFELLGVRYKVLELRKGL